MEVSYKSWKQICTRYLLYLTALRYIHTCAHTKLQVQIRWTLSSASCAQSFQNSILDCFAVWPVVPKIGLWNSWQVTVFEKQVCQTIFGFSYACCFTKLFWWQGHHAIASINVLAKWREEKSVIMHWNNYEHDLRCIYFKIKNFKICAKWAYKYICWISLQPSQKGGGREAVFFIWPYPSSLQEGVIMVSLTTVSFCCLG